MKKILTGVLIAANLLMLTAGIITIPPNFRDGAAQTDSEPSASQNAATSRPDSTPASAQSGEKVYGLGEAGESDGFAITIDGVSQFIEPDIFYHNELPEGFVHIRVDFSYKNITDETKQPSSMSGMYVVYEDSPARSDRKSSGSDEDNVFNFNRDGMFSSLTEIAPGETYSSWDIFQWPVDRDEITMRFYAPPRSSYDEEQEPDLLYKFPAPDLTAAAATPDETAMPDTTDAPPTSGLALQDAVGTYEYRDPNSGAIGQIEIKNNGGSMIMQFPDGSVVYYTYDAASATASHSETVDGASWEYIVSFTPDGTEMGIAILSRDVTVGGSGQELLFLGRRISVADLSTTDRPDFSDFVWYLDDVMYNGVPEHAINITDRALVNGDWKALIVHDPERIMESFATEYLNVNIETADRGVTMTLDWYEMYFEYDAEPFDVSNLEDSEFYGQWEGDGFWASGPGTIHINQFYEINVKQFAIGAYDSPDGTPAYIALVRP